MRKSRGNGMKPRTEATISSRQAYALLAVIIIAGLAIAAYFYSGPLYTFDDGQYITYARQMMHGNFSITQDPHAFGYLTPMTVAASFLIFGQSPFSAALPGIVEYVLIIMLAFLVGRELFDVRVGLTASLLVIITPTVFSYATRVLPDMLIGVLVGAALYAFACGAKEGRNKAALIFASGFFFGMVIFVKIGGGFAVLPALIGVAVFYRKAIINFASGMFASVMLYFASFYALSGGHLSLISEYSATQAALMPHGYLALNFITMLDMIAGPVQIYQVYPLGLIVVFAFISTYIAITRKDRSLCYLSLIFWFAFFYLFYGTESLSQYAFITVVNRYLIAVSVPLVLLPAFVLVDLYKVCEAVLGKRLAVSIFVVLILLTVASNFSAYGDVYAFRNYILNNPAPPGFFG